MVQSCKFKPDKESRRAEQIAMNNLLKSRGSYLGLAPDRESTDWQVPYETQNFKVNNNCKMINNWQKLLLVRDYCSLLHVLPKTLQLHCSIFNTCLLFICKVHCDLWVILPSSLHNQLRYWLTGANFANKKKNKKTHGANFIRKMAFLQTTFCHSHIKIPIQS